MSSKRYTSENKLPVPQFATNLTTMFNKVAFPLRFEAAS